MKNSNDEIDQIIRQAYEAKYGPVQKQKFIFLLVGRTGVGKSSTVNSMMDKEVARVGDYEPTTISIELFDNEAFGIKFTIIDTPGLADDLEEKGNDTDYLEIIRAQVPRVDCLWFVTRLDDTRVSSDEKRAIEIISEALGQDIWKRAIIIFTFANNIEKDRYDEAIKKRTELVRAEIARWANSSIAETIPSVAVDNKSRKTPDEEQWLGILYTKVFSLISDSGFLPFLMATEKRLKIIPKNKNHKKQSYMKNLDEGKIYIREEDVPIMGQRMRTFGETIGVGLNIMIEGGKLVIETTVRGLKKGWEWYKGLFKR
jgi:GTPase SAR1 family protein